MTKTAIKKPVAPKATPKAPLVFKVLSTAMLISGALFDKLSMKERTKILSSNEGKPIEFLDNFFALADSRVIIAKLLEGKEVTRELEFNDIILSPEETAAITAVKPVLEKIAAIAPAYPWLADDGDTPGIIFTATKLARNGYKMNVGTAKLIWNKGSMYWSGGDKPASHSVSADGYSRRPEYFMDRVVVGCQTISRFEWEYAARHYGWEPVTFA